MDGHCSPLKIRASLPNVGCFYSGNITRRYGQNKSKRTREKPVITQAEYGEEMGILPE